MQRGRENRTPSLSSSLADSDPPSPRPPYSATNAHRSHVRWSNSISPDDPLRNRGSYMPQEQSSSRRHQIKDKVKGKKSTTAKDHPKEGSSDRSSSSSALKTSLVFLGSVAAATYVANRFWPRGVTYGDRERWEEEEPRQQHERRRRRRSASRQSRRLRRGSSDDEGVPRPYRGGGRGAERVVYDDEEGPSRRGLSRGRSHNPRYAVVEVVPARGSSRAASTRQEQQYDPDSCSHSRSGDRRRLSSSYYHYHHDGGERRYYSPVRLRDEDEDEFDKGRRSTTIYREPRYVEHQVTTLRRSSSDDPYTTTERVVRRQYRLDERG
ncbi:hypothetical protein PG999_003518 [Apiospora kogelbergensis]|uniref:Uncharacterized protein n=1 Tax=Apiospora kogelbergensis TaxID=1337665 RepID=A0AAW0R3P8_9PEZI